MLPSVETMIEKLTELDPRMLTSWEVDFLNNVEDQTSAGDCISEAQYEVLEKLFRDKILNVI